MVTKQNINTRTADIKRLTGETDVSVSINLDGTGSANIDTGYKFLDHMLTLLSWFSFMDITVIVKGDRANQPDDHHIIEDVGIVLGQAFRKAVGSMEWGSINGISRYGSFAVPMDECLVLVAVDIYTRGLAVIDLPSTRENIGDVATESLIHFFSAFAENAQVVIQVKTLSNGNTHHLLESAFKSLAKALEQAIRIDERLVLRVPGKIQ